MHTRLRPLACAAVLATWGVSAFAQAGPGFDVKFGGFATVGIAHSSEKEANFVSDPFQVTGPGLAKSIGFEPDTKLGLQASAALTPKLSATVQLLSMSTALGNWEPRVEWANLKYAFTPELSVRLGRTALPAFLISESRAVGYSQHWVRPPIEVYGVLSITSNDGVDVSWRQRVSGGTNTLQAYAGSNTRKVRSGGILKATQAFGINDTFETGAWTLRVGFNSVVYKLNSPDLSTGLYGNLEALQGALAGIPVFSAQAATLAEVIRTHDVRDAGPTRSLALGLNYDPGDWFLTADFVNTTAQAFHAQRAYAVSGGMRVGKWTPYATYAHVTSTRSVAAMDTTGLPAQMAGGIQALLGALNGFATDLMPPQSSVALGVRWDVAPNMDVKLQLDRIRTKPGTDGHFVGGPAGGFPDARTNHVVSLAADFVF